MTQRPQTAEPQPARRKGRPAGEARRMVSMSWPETVLRRIDAHALADHVTRTQFVLDALEQYCAARERSA